MITRVQGLRTWVGTLIGAGIALFTVLGVTAAPADAADADTRIVHAQTSPDGLQVVVDVPAEVNADLSGVRVTVEGHQADAVARRVSGSSQVRRTAVLAFDTSNSMKGPRFEAAKSAAKAYLDSVPSDVRIGIVTFASEVAEPLSPTTDRDAAQAVIDSLSLSRRTALYDGVSAALRMAGTEGQRTVLVLSDGKDAGSRATLSETVRQVADSEIVLDAVSLDQLDVAGLRELADAGRGSVILADSGNVASAFSAEAATLSRQILVTAQVPAEVSALEGTVQVEVPTDAGISTAAGLVRIQEAVVPSMNSAATTRSLPAWTSYLGVGLLGLALLAILGVLLTSTTSKRLTPADRVIAYTDRKTHRLDTGHTDSLATAKQAASRVLARNVDLDERISRRLDEAGSELRSSEWLLLHTACLIGTVLLGALIGGGSILVILLFLALGIVGPWLYLGFRRSQRVKKFNAALPDTLQLMSGSLAAGLSLAQSVDTIVKEGSEPMAGEFRRVLIETRLGVPIEDALEGITARFASKDFAWVVLAIRIQRQVGGNLAELLDTVAGTIREREYLRRQVATLSAEGKMSAWVLGALPPLFMVYLVLTQGDYVKPMFTEPIGWVMLLGAGTLLSVGVFWMSRLVKVDV